MQGQAIVIECQNCKNKIAAWRDKNGIAKAQCPHCGAVITTSLKSRRHLQIDIYAPKGQRFY